MSRRGTQNLESSHLGCQKMYLFLYHLSGCPVGFLNASQCCYLHEGRSFLCQHRKLKIAPPAVTGGGTAGFHKEGAGHCCPHLWVLPALGSPSSADSSGLKSAEPMWPRGLGPQRPGSCHLEPEKLACLIRAPTFLRTLEHSFLLIPHLLHRGLLSSRVCQGKSHK